jgi:hypothetical protein
VTNDDESPKIYLKEDRLLYKNIQESLRKKAEAKAASKLNKSGARKIRRIDPQRDPWNYLWSLKNDKKK